MKRIFSLLVIGIVLFTASKTNNPPETSKKNILSVEQILADPSAYVDKEVLVSGTVSRVAKWMGRRCSCSVPLQIVQSG